MNLVNERVGTHPIGDLLTHNLRSSFEEPPDEEGEYILNDDKAIKRDVELEGFNTYSLKDSISSLD